MEGQAATLTLAGRTVPVTVRRSRRARRLRLEVCAARRCVVLVVPWRAPAEAARRFLCDRTEWLACQVARAIPPARPFRAGLELVVDDQPLVLAEGPVRRPVRMGDRLWLPAGPPAQVAHWVQAFLRAEARRLMEPEARALAARAGRAVARVRIGDPESLWGSCSAAGVLMFSWRLVLAPRAVRRAVVAHEVAHLVHRDHGPAFRQLAEALFGAPLAPAEAWLKAQGPWLFALGAER
ncbi:MAG: M48 family metallopeptidase [Sphingomonadaceae bacterium]|uniref:M48 family metallopeptidase n=1 Tax=Thermaurantiacus sp. TaxID=2820283 RepID=UPI00298F318C|nr:YgjP-like metallopeptidase domain-containing protein [Thermaurantiacus sp.]MCS6987438.1 M48 family metallopeptidase [Sphingomonadaceae bacterium]MDW8415358.1 DUF45 domain-containing protein [Thermaurantiacus sp.]